jgi:hypothetical protein
MYQSYSTQYCKILITHNHFTELTRRVFRMTEGALPGLCGVNMTTMLCGGLIAAKTGGVIGVRINVRAQLRTALRIEVEIPVISAALRIAVGISVRMILRIAVRIEVRIEVRSK